MAYKATKLRTQGTSVTREVIYPDDALRYLDTNLEQQRRIKEALVNRIAHDILMGAWEFNGATICFDHSGRLIDGQHRLRACIKTGKPIETMVVRGLRNEAFATIDMGAKRSLNDVLRTMGYKNAVILSVVLRRLELLESQSDFMNVDLIARITTADSLRFLEQNDDLPDFVNKYAGMADKQLLSPTVVVTILAALRGSTRYLEIAEEFFDEVFTEHEKQAGNPAHLLRGRLLRSRMAIPTKQLTTYLRSALTVKAWNAWATGAEMFNLRYKRFGNHAETFPPIYPLEYGNGNN